MAAMNFDDVIARGLSSNESMTCPKLGINYAIEYQPYTTTIIVSSHRVYIVKLSEPKLLLFIF